MGRNRLTIGQFKVKNLPFVDGVFSVPLEVSYGQPVTITREAISTGNRGRKPFVYRIQRLIAGGTFEGMLEPTVTLGEALAPATAGGSDE